jgi:hypothetical protein
MIFTRKTLALATAGLISLVSPTSQSEESPFNPLLPIDSPASQSVEENTKPRPTFGRSSFQNDGKYTGMAIRVDLDGDQKYDGLAIVGLEGVINIDYNENTINTNSFRSMVANGTLPAKVYWTEEAVQKLQNHTLREIVDKEISPSLPVETVPFNHPITGVGLQGYQFIDQFVTASPFDDPWLTWLENGNHSLFIPSKESEKYFFSEASITTEPSVAPPNSIHIIQSAIPRQCPLITKEDELLYKNLDTIVQFETRSGEYVAAAVIMRYDGATPNIYGVIDLGGLQNANPDKNPIIEYDICALAETGKAEVFADSASLNALRQSGLLGAYYAQGFGDSTPKEITFSNLIGGPLLPEHTDKRYFHPPAILPCKED